MAVLKIVLTVLFIVVCLALAVIILLQESKSSGLGAISGAADTYWGKNKGRSMEGKLEKGTRVLVVLFFLFAILLNIPSIADSSAKSSSNDAEITVDGDSANDTADDATDNSVNVTDEEAQ